MNPEEKEMYDLRMKAIRDEMNIRESGYIDGLAIGETKGKKEQKIEIAKNMLKKQMTVQDIADITGLSPEEIKNLQ